ncbi:hypothetical protein BLNAU_3248 [Blattamonas nauphoetae]|uniref:Uncharacterized protein n=1 Tax=Blattamonas nauphoetae TaxID=2049346 RepID=A0ABQ9YDH1_9EUKA|nr:hypothetical protein BLNAU_3248 [Blattamonas nauphoetae]
MSVAETNTLICSDPSPNSNISCRTRLQTRSRHLSPHIHPLFLHQNDPSTTTVEGKKEEEDGIPRLPLFLRLSLVGIPRVGVGSIPLPDGLTVLISAEPSSHLPTHLPAVGQDSPNPAAVILSTPHLRDLSIIEYKDIVEDILTIFRSGIWLANTNTVQYICTKLGTAPHSIQDVLLHDELIPIEPSLVQLSRNPRLLSWNDEFKQMLELLTYIFDVSPFHKPTLDFICSSRVPIIFQSLLSNVEEEHVHIDILGYLYNRISEWKCTGTETWDRGRLLLQALEQEGLRDHPEQTLLHHKSSWKGIAVRNYSFRIMNTLGMNSPLPY